MGLTQDKYSVCVYVCVFMCELKTAKTQLIQPRRGTQTRNGPSCVVMVMLHSGRPTSAVKTPKNTQLQQKRERVCWPPHTQKRKKRGENTHSRAQQSLKNRAMTLQEEEKSVIQAGAYMVIKSHVKKEEKKKSNATPPPNSR